jgi:hypothetical protein
MISKTKIRAQSKITGYQILVEIGFLIKIWKSIFISYFALCVVVVRNSRECMLRITENVFD